MLFVEYSVIWSEKLSTKVKKIYIKMQFMVLMYCYLLTPHLHPHLPTETVGILLGNSGENMVNLHIEDFPYHENFTSSLHSYIFLFTGIYMNGTWWQFCQYHLVEIFFYYSSILITEPRGMGTFSWMVYTRGGAFTSIFQTPKCKLPTLPQGLGGGVVETNDWCINSLSNQRSHNSLKY